MSWLIPPLRPNFTAALRDVHARTTQARLAAAERLAEPEPGEEHKAVEALTVLMADSNPRIRLQAVQSIARIGDSRALRLVADRLNDEEAAVREMAVVAISQIGGPRAVTMLRRALHNPHPEIRFQAVVCYAELCPRESGQDIARLLDDDDAKVRSNAACALGLIGESVARDRLRTALEDSDPDVRQEAAVALAKLGDRAGLPVLRDALVCPSRIWDALGALTDLKDREAANAIAAFADGVFQPLMVKAEAARALVVMDDPRGSELLRKVLRAWRSDGRSHAVKIVGELGLVELAPELKRLAIRPRGTDLEILIQALAALAPRSAVASDGLSILARRADQAGQQARDALTKIELEADSKPQGET